MPLNKNKQNSKCSLYGNRDKTVNNKHMQQTSTKGVQDMMGGENDRLGSEQDIKIWS